LDIIEVNLVITAFVSGVIFTIAIIFTGILSDYKESEQIPGKLAACFKTLFMDIRIATINNEKMTFQMHSHLQEFLRIINQNFRQDVWKLREIHPACKYGQG
jgi:hypothetical protein